MQTNRQEITPNQFLKNLSIIHMALIGGLILFSAVVYFVLIENWTFNFAVTEDIFFYVIPVFAFVNIVGGNLTYKNQVEKLKSKKTLKEKLEGLQKAMIIKFAMVEVSSIACIISAFITSNSFYFLSAGILIIYIISQKPSKSNIERDLNLNFELRSQFNKSDQIVS